MRTIRAVLTLLIASMLIAGCASTRTTAFLDPNYIFAGIERAAVLPFANLTNDQGIGRYSMRVFITELLAEHVFDIVETGEVSAYIAKHNIASTDELSIEQITDMGKALNVQAIILGTVGESAPFRSGNLNTYVISMDVRMISVEDGTTTWSASVTTGGPAFLPRLFGLGERSRSQIVRKVVRKVISTLVR